MSKHMSDEATPIKRSPGNRYSAEAMLQAVIRSQGRVASAARKLGCEPKTIWEASRRNPKLNAAIHNERELFIDTAEDQLQKAVKRGAPWAVVFTLKTIGRDRGYSEVPQLQQVIVQQAQKEEPDPYKLAAQAIALLIKQGIINQELFLPAPSTNGKANGHDE